MPAEHEPQPEQPEQTDNRPAAEDGPQDVDQTSAPMPPYQEVPHSGAGEQAGMAAL